MGREVREEHDPPRRLALGEWPGEVEDHALVGPRGDGFADLGLLEIDHDLFGTNAGSGDDQRQ